MHESEKKVKLLSRIRLFATPWTAAYQAPPSMGFPGKSTGVGCHCLLHSNVDITINKFYMTVITILNAVVENVDNMH